MAAKLKNGVKKSMDLDNRLKVDPDVLSKIQFELFAPKPKVADQLEDEEEEQPDEQSLLFDEALLRKLQAQVRMAKEIEQQSEKNKRRARGNEPELMWNLFTERLAGNISINVPTKEIFLSQYLLQWH